MGLLSLFNFLTLNEWLVLIMFVVGLNLLGDGLRDALDPKNESHS